MRLVIEISGSHGGSLDNCISLIRCAKLLNPASIKFQRFNPERLALKRIGNPSTAKALGKTVSIRELTALYRSTETPRQWWPRIMATLDGHPWSCSVFSPEDLRFIMTYDCPSLKIASFELKDIGLIERCADMKKPIVLSANADATADEILDACMAAKGCDITLLYATGYGASNIEAELERMFFVTHNCPNWVKFGLSDHTIGSDFARQSLDLCDVDMIERHIKLADVPTADSDFSLTPSEMLDYMEAIDVSAKVS
jgi:sialic acid synthase SpsE